MVTIEQIDEFRKRTNSSYGDAKYFLEKNQGDILEAIIDFENTKTGKTQNTQKKSKDDFARRFAFILQQGFDTRICVEDKGTTLFMVPVILLLLLIPFWPIALLLFIFLYVLGYKFSLRDVKSQNINVNSFFQNINDKMKENGTSRENPHNGSEQRNPGQSDGGKPQNESHRPQAAEQSIVPVEKAEAPVPDMEQKKDEGYKEYTVE